MAKKALSSEPNVIGINEKSDKKNEKDEKAKKEAIDKAKTDHREAKDHADNLKRAVARLDNEDKKKNFSGSRIKRERLERKLMALESKVALSNATVGKLKARLSEETDRISALDKQKEACNLMLKRILKVA